MCSVTECRRVGRTGASSSRLLAGEVSTGAGGARWHRPQVEGTGVASPLPRFPLSIPGAAPRGITRMYQFALARPRCR